MNFHSISVLRWYFTHPTTAVSILEGRHVNECGRNLFFPFENLSFDAWTNVKCSGVHYWACLSDLPEATEIHSWRTCDVCKIACNWWNREPRNSLRDNVKWNIGRTDYFAKPSGTASNVMSDLAYCEWRGIQGEGDCGNWGCVAYIFCTFDPHGLKRELIAVRLSMIILSARTREVRVFRRGSVALLTAIRVILPP